MLYPSLNSEILNFYADPINMVLGSPVARVSQKILSVPFQRGMWRQTCAKIDWEKWVHKDSMYNILPEYFVKYGIYLHF